MKSPFGSDFCLIHPKIGSNLRSFVGNLQILEFFISSCPIFADFSKNWPFSAWYQDLPGYTDIIAVHLWLLTTFKQSINSLLVLSYKLFPNISYGFSGDSGTAVSCLREAGISQEVQAASIDDTDDSFKLLAKKLEELNCVVLWKKHSLI